MKEQCKKSALLFKSVYMSVILFVLIFALAVYSAISFAWLSEQKNVTAMGMSVVSIESDVSIKATHCYPVTNISGDSYTFANTEVNSIPLYDLNNITYSEYRHAVVIKLEYSSPSAESSYNFMAKLADNSSFFSSGTSNLLSNIARFRAGSVSGNTFTAASSVSFLTYGSSVSQDSDITKINGPLTLCELNESAGEVYFILEYDTVPLNYICRKRSMESDAHLEVNYLADIIIYVQKDGG